MMKSDFFFLYCAEMLDLIIGIEMDIQTQYDRIYEYFKTTTEPFDNLEWDGYELLVIMDCKVIERYDINLLRKLLKDFA